MQIQNNSHNSQDAAKARLQNVLTELLQDKLLENTGDFLLMRAQDEQKIYTTDTAKNPTTQGLEDIKELESKFYADILHKDSSIEFILKTSARFIGTVALSQKIQPPVLDDMAQILGAVIKNYPEHKIGKIQKRLQKFGVVLLHSGSAIITGKNKDDLIAKSLILDKATTIYVNASLLGGAKILPKLDSVLMNVVYKFQYSKQNENIESKEIDLPPPTDEREIQMRNTIKESGLKLLQENLVQRTWGNTSMRFDEKYFLATPSGIDYVQLKPNQCAFVEIENPSNWIGRLKPTGERKIHAGVLKMREEVNAVIHSHPVYAGIFASAGVDLELENPQDKEILQAEKIKISSYGLPGTKKLTKGALLGLGKRAKATILKSHGIIAVGKDMDDAFLSVLTLEQACKASIEKQLEKQTGKSYADSDLKDYFLKWRKNH